MSDLYLGLLILLGLSVVLFGVGLMVGRRASRRVAVGVGLAVTAGLLLFALAVHGKLFVARWLPFSNAIVVGNWIPLGAALLGGLLAGQSGIARWRRAVFAAAIVGLAWYSVALNFTPTSLPAGDRWTDDGVCLQSSEASCSPCAAATLLRHHGIETGEREMISLCLTRRGGTPSLGLYRGIKLKTRGTPWQVEVVRGSFDRLRGPVVLRMRLANDPGAYPRLLEQIHLAPDTGHAMVFYRLSGDGRALMADPSVGLQWWAVEDIKARWRGEGLRLVRPQSSQSQSPQSPISQSQWICSFGKPGRTTLRRLSAF